MAHPRLVLVMASRADHHGVVSARATRAAASVTSGVQAVDGAVSAAGDRHRPFRGLVDWAGGLWASREADSRQLRAQNEELRARLAELEEARLENERLRALVDSRGRRAAVGRRARVIGRPRTLGGRHLIDRGLRRRRSGRACRCIGAQGLVGQIVEVSPGSSKVRLITDQRSGVAAHGAARPAPTASCAARSTGDLSLDFVSKDTTGQARAMCVITSGIGGVYPRGFVVGEVSEVAARARRALPADRGQRPVCPPGIEEVLVLVGVPARVEPQGGE